LLDEALKVFNEIGQRDMISWSAMNLGLAQNGQGKEALKLFQQMQLVGIMPDSKTFASNLRACGNLAALEQGMKIQGRVK
jgi:pentatricopeptide repeat protein